MELNLKNKVALIIASSQGLGKAIATQLVKEGTNVVITSRNADKLKNVQSELRALNKGKVEYFQADITNQKDIQSLRLFTKEKFGKIDILINNAGGPPSGSFTDLTDEDWQNAFELNLLSYIRIIREVLPDLKESGGKIINIASSSIKQPIPGLILSNTFRMGIVGLTKTLADEFAADKILINTVAPGRIYTERIEYLESQNAKRNNKSIAEVKEESLKSAPLGRYGRPEEFANVVTFLASDASSYVTGTSIMVDGGSVKAI